MKRRISILILSLALLLLLPIGVFADTSDMDSESDTITIEDAEAPETGSIKCIEIASPDEKWAISNLIFTLSTIIISIALLPVKFKPKKGAVISKEDRRDLSYFKAITILIAIVSLIFFLFTEDITLEIQLIDKWTIVSFVIFIDQLFASIMIQKNARGSKKDEQWRQNEWWQFL